MNAVSPEGDDAGQAILRDTPGKLVGKPVRRAVKLSHILMRIARLTLVPIMAMFVLCKGILKASASTATLVESGSFSSMFMSQWRETVAFMSYKLAQIVAASTATKILLLFLFSFGLVLAGGAVFIISGEVSQWSEALFKSYALLNNAPGTSAVDEESFTGSLLANMIYVTGILTFAVVLGVVSSSITVALETALEGNHPVVERGHVVVLNWGPKTIPTIKQLDMSAKEGRRSRTVVVLAQKENSEMQQMINDELENPRINIMTRSGNPNSVNDLNRVSAGRAGHVILLPSDEEDFDTDRLTSQAACVKGLLQENHLESHVLVTPEAGVDERDMPGCTVVSRGSFSQRVIAMTAFQHGIADVYAEILNQGEGCEIYVRPVSGAWSHLVGKPFSQLLSHFPNAVPIGLSGPGDDVKPVMNPDGARTITAGDKLILLAKDKKIECTKFPAQGESDTTTQTSASAHKSGKKASKRLIRSALIRSEKAKKVLVLGVASGESLQYLDDALPDGSKVTVLTSENIQLPSGLKNKYKVIQGSYTSTSDLEEAGAHKHDVALFLDADKDDSRSLASMRLIMQLRESEDVTERMHVVAALDNDLFSPLIRSVCGKGGTVTCDVVLSDVLESGALVQVLWDSCLKHVYQDLLDSDGCELALVDATKFAEASETLSFGQLAERVQNEGAIALGLLRHGRVMLAPPKDVQLILTPGDQLVVFADTF